jgi:hypothetical protein
MRDQLVLWSVTRRSTSSRNVVPASRVVVVVVGDLDSLVACEMRARDGKISLLGVPRKQVGVIIRQLLLLIIVNINNYC